MKFTRIAGACVGAAALTLALAIPAQAAQEEGYKSCSGIGSGDVVTRGYTNGYQSHYQNGAATHFGDSGYSWVVHLWNIEYTTANWKVYSSKNLDPVGTYAYCAS